MTAKSPSPSEIVLKAATLDVPTQEDTELPDLAIDLEEHKLQHQLDALRQELQESRDNHKLRMQYAGRIFWLICGWLACVFVCLLLTGFNSRFFLWTGSGFLLSDKVLMTFITTTTLNVIAIFIIVAKWMYPNGPHGDKKVPNKSKSAAKD